MHVVVAIVGHFLVGPAVRRHVSEKSELFKNRLGRSLKQHKLNTELFRWRFYRYDAFVRLVGLNAFVPLFVELFGLF